jgi:hypothetical protein
LGRFIKYQIIFNIGSASVELEGKCWKASLLLGMKFPAAEAEIAKRWRVSIYKAIEKSFNNEYYHRG